MSHDALLTETIARHFPDARISDGEIDLGFAGLRMRCQVNQILPWGSYQAAALFFDLRGSLLGPVPIFASVSGYDESPERAIVEGACNWACAFGPVLRAGLAGENQPSVDRFEVTVGGQAFRVCVDRLDRSLLFADEDIGNRSQIARKRFGASPWLTTLVLKSGRLPILNPNRPTILSVFACDHSAERLIEVKVNGRDWPGVDQAFAHVPPEPVGAVVMLREFAVLVPVGDAQELSRDAVETTLAGLRFNAERPAVAWPGWRKHGGTLQPPANPDALVRLERSLGPLPADYRRFMLNVAAKGAGPGYGLLSPFGDAQQILAGGEFSFVDGDEAAKPPAGVLALASAGCGVMWLLVIRGPNRGEVWVHGTGSDLIARRVAGSFSEWYRAWIDGAARDAGPFCQWDAAQCGTPSLLTKFLSRLESKGIRGDEAAARIATDIKAGAISISANDSPYFPRGAPLDPCQSCVALVARFGLRDDVFTPGIPPLQADDS